MTSHGHIRLIQTLTYAGALPFIAWPLALLLLPHWSYLTLQFAPDYMRVIVSFMAGGIWGTAIATERLGPSTRKAAALAAILAALALWGAAAIPYLRLQVIVAIALFFVLLTVDRSLTRDGAVPDWYGRLRIRITAIVSLSLIATVLVLP